MKRYVRPISCFSVPHELEDERAHRNIRHGDGLVGHEEVGPRDQGARQHDPLALAAGKLVGILAIEELGGGQPHLLHEVEHPFAPLRAVPMPWMESGWAIACPTLMRGLREELGSWNTICARERRCSISPGAKLVMSLPRYSTRPEVGSMRRRSSLPVVDLPEPLSPASPSTSPSSIAKLTLSTACTLFRLGKEKSKIVPRSGELFHQVPGGNKERHSVALAFSAPYEASRPPHAQGHAR